MVSPVCLVERSRARGVHSTESRSRCQDLAIVFDRDYSEPLVFSREKKRKEKKRNWHAGAEPRGLQSLQQ